MKKNNIFFILVFLISHFSFSQSTNISGIINSYTSVFSIGTQSVTVSTTSGFLIGDKVLIIQMKGAVINTNNNPSFGTILNYNDAGNYEIITIASITGTTINFTTPIIRTYSATGLVQLVKIPIYTNAVVTSTLSCLPWNGTIGGVLAFEATGSITLNADIDISGNGFAGGGRFHGSYQCMGDTDAYVLPVSNVESSNKGEGIVIYNSAFAEGKGAYANGGGSGNDINGGGAGGGNYGLGGMGGGTKSSGSCPTYYFMNCGGIGGDALLYSNSQNKIFLGGGGGAGHENDNVGTAGVNGGGIILIEAGNIIGNGNFIRSDGQDNNIIAGNDGQGGGGAGGTILLNACSYTSLNVSVKGGKGGTDNFTGPDCHGKGGGGAGGIIWSSTLLTNVTTFLTGGNPGVFTNSNSTCFGGSNGATAGKTGGTLTGLIIPGGSIPTNQVDSNICSTSSVTLDAGAASSYTWSTGSNTQTISTNNSGTFWVDIQPLGGCKQIDTFHVSIINPAIYAVLKDTTICNNTTCVLNASSSNATNYNWSTGATSSSITVSTGGIYWVDMSIGECVIRDSAQITLLNSPVLNLKDTVSCTSPVILNVNDTSLIVNWSTGSNSQTISVNTTGTYWVQVQNQNGCRITDTIHVTIFNPSLYNILKDTSVCSNINYILNASSANATSYNWSTGATSSSITPTTTGIYWVDIHVNQCIVRDSADIILINPPLLNLKDTVICKDPITINIADTSLLVNWWNGSHSNQISINTAGTYSISVSKNGCSTIDIFNVTNVEFATNFIIPNIITPNGDGINDFFEFNTNGIIIKEFYLYNRWGKLVYSSTNNFVKWDGKQGNELVDDGTYYWTGIFNNPCGNSVGDIKQKGFITVLK